MTMKQELKSIFVTIVVMTMICIMFITLSAYTQMTRRAIYQITSITQLNNLNTCNNEIGIHLDRGETVKNTDGPFIGN